MCGIAGLLDSTKSPTHDDLSAMNDCLAHRGPDDAGTYIDGPVGLAHRRLSIIDPDAPAQPQFNEDDSVVVVFNGEIYNHRMLRNKLSGHSFQTDTDTEVLVHLYEEHGPSFVERLEGMFAFALWDRDRERLLLTRDPMGIKPLYVGLDNTGRIAFGSELTSLFEADFDLGGLDHDAVAEYFAFGYIPAPKSAFRNVSKLEPGEMYCITEEEVNRKKFYTPSIRPVDTDFETAASNLRERIENAVKKRLQADVPLGAFLSGGIDSSIVTAVLSSVSDSPVDTFSIGFQESQFDETWAAREVAEYHDTNHHEYTVSPSDVRGVIDEVIPRLGEPFADSSILPTYVVSRETSRELTVALSGDGADELFAGYNKYRGEYVSNYYRAIPGSVRRGLVEPAVERLPASRGTRHGELSRKAQKFVRSAGADRADRQYEWMAITTNNVSGALQEIQPQEQGVKRITGEQEEALSALPSTRADNLSVMQLVDAQFALPSGILTKVDRASMFNSLEVRVPFLDVDVFEYAMGLPRKYKITPRTRKRILKHAFRDELPDSIRKRGKQGFEVPIGEWFKNELAAEFTSTLQETGSEILDRNEIMRIYREHTEGNKDHTNFLWAVYVFSRWHNQMRNRGILP
jgi:asparagine synthase (glutamine-hydrolysing)